MELTGRVAGATFGIQHRDAFSWHSKSGRFLIVELYCKIAIAYISYCHRLSFMLLVAQQLFNLVRDPFRWPSGPLFSVDCLIGARTESAAESIREIVDLNSIACNSIGEIMDHAGWRALGLSSRDCRVYLPARLSIVSL